MAYTLPWKMPGLKSSLNTDLEKQTVVFILNNYSLPLF